MYSEEFIADIVDFCEKKGIYLIMDDIYHRLIFDGKKPFSAYDYTKKSVEESKTRYHQWRFKTICNDGI